MALAETRKSRARFPPHIQSRRLAQMQAKNFWASHVDKMPVYRRRPWDFYRPLLELDVKQVLALCIQESECRRIQTMPYDPSMDSSLESLVQIQHRNFVHYHEIYIFEEQAFVVSDYVELSLTDIIENARHLTELELAYIISQVLVGIRFIATQKVESCAISERAIRITREGNVKIDPTVYPKISENLSSDTASIASLMLTMMGETKETINTTPLHPWSSMTLDFVNATSWATIDELSEHMFLLSAGGPESLAALCTLSHLTRNNVGIMEGFSERHGS